ncbi:MAG TPA: LUD domain-containing protein [Terracidiphilus sp.]|nr:LUD domain-containing protein [Terracidiphilus sp.]
MNTPASSRTLILQRIREASRNAAPSAYPDLLRAYTHAGLLPAEDRIRLMAERLREYDADVVECAPAHLPAAIAAKLSASGRRRFVAPPGLPADWLTEGFDWLTDHALSIADIESCEGVVTAASAGVADSGTIVLHHTASEGRRILSLLPDWHLCVLHASQVVETLPEYFSRCTQPPTLVTWISGPSATADIEMTRIKGVHGPRFLHIVLVRDDDSDSSPAKPEQSLKVGPNDSR